MIKKVFNIAIMILLMFSIIGCSKNDERVREHVLKSEELSPYIIVKAKSYHIYDFENKLEKITIFDLYLNIESYKEKNQNKVDYELDAYNALGELTSYKSNVPLLLPATEQLIYNNTVGGNGFNEFFLKLNNGINYHFYEEVLGTTNEDIRKHGYADEFISEIIDLSINISEDDEKYNFEFVIDSSENVHIDFQSFATSIDAKVYSFFAVYGYNRNKFPFIENNNYIYKNMDIDYIYTRLVYYDEVGEKTEISTRFLLEDLLNIDEKKH